ncbi:AAA family ATPase [Actinoplanes sp. NPDC048967]|uniref:AAA family ATPase n=1 Tax=Actinoplanes sp. NPDC048967 TaxID=3155269 RepID=UPI0033FE7724
MWTGLEVIEGHRRASSGSVQVFGEQRRLDFATAVYGRPELIVLDEPTTGLDIQSRDALWEAVAELRGNGSTVILTTHYLEEAQQHADRIGLMHRGTVRPDPAGRPHRPDRGLLAHRRMRPASEAGDDTE